MQNSLLIERKFNLAKFAIIDFIMVGLFLLVPSISHMFSIPLYYAEPMRIIVLLSILYTNRNNSIVLALLLPFISLVVSSHPYLLKSVLIACELAVNIFAFFILAKSLKNILFASFGSILISKAFYYSVKGLFLNMGLINGELIATPIIAQVISTVLLTAAFYFLYTKLNKE
ncbi:MAG: hypothetical protein WC055_10850 [Melioribacteraceae bacterium]